jgi:uncharacterized protein (TIGR04141 family)
MSEKRSNNAIWKIALTEGEAVQDRLSSIVESYNRLSRADSKYAPLKKVELEQAFEDVEISLYTRTKWGLGFFSFVAEYLANKDEVDAFRFKSVDACLFIATATSLFAVTSGSGYNIIGDDVDYSFPFEVAKKLVANNFKTAEMRQFTGATTSRIETYRRGQSIASSESFGKVWKRLVGRLNSGLLPEDSSLLKIIDPNRPPAIEVKSSFVLRKSLDLRQLVELAREIDELPAATEDQLRELSFLDNLYQVKSKSLIAALKRQLIENLRLAATSGEQFDLDICDPDDVNTYYAGSDFRLSRWQLEGDPPDTDDVINVLRSNCQESLEDADSFYEKVASLMLRYSRDPDGDDPPIAKDLYKFMHGQVEHKEETYFLLDKIWYRIQGDFLANLKKDFIEETFFTSSPILMGDELPFMAWSDVDEDAFNRRQAQEDGFHYGDKIFATSNRGKVELFDLLKVDKANKTLYIIHVKAGFDAKMRDACSQISISAEVIEQDVRSDKAVLKAYYLEWQKNEVNAGKGVSEQEFVGWFDLNIVYVVLASTRADFTPVSFERNVLSSHIARREIVVTRNELKSRGNVFRLAHTKRT